jgi:phosphatidate cytidylyltransferase
MKFKNLGARFVVGFALFAVIVLVVWLRGWVFGALITVFALVSQWEMYGAMRAASFRPGVWPGYLFAASMYLVFHFKGLSSLVAVFTVLCAVLIALNMTMPRRRFIDTVISVFSMVYPSWFFFFLLALEGLQWQGPQASARLSQVALAAALLGPVATDCGGYFFGGFFGSRKLSPAISPKKTVEGAVGAVLTTVVVFAAGGALVRQYFFDGLPFFHYPLMAILVSVLAQAGDLMASSIKRFAGIKDFSTLLPGHGGFMDRMDSILFGAVAVYCYLELFFLS